MPNHYDPNQPRNAEGEWTDAGDAIKAAASDSKGQLNIENYKSWNGKVYKDAIYINGEKITDPNIIAKYQAAANIEGEINDFFKDSSNDKAIIFMSIHKKKIAVAIVNELGTDNLKGVGYSVSGLFLDEINRNRELTNTPEKMIKHILKSFSASE